MCSFSANKKKESKVSGCNSIGHGHQMPQNRKGRIKRKRSWFTMGHNKKNRNYVFANLRGFSKKKEEIIGFYHQKRSY